MLTLRTAHTGTGNVVGQDLTSLGLSDPEDLVAQLAACGWLALPGTPGDLLASRPESPTPITVPSSCRPRTGPGRSRSAGRCGPGSPAGPRRSSGTRSSASAKAAAGTRLLALALATLHRRLRAPRARRAGRRPDRPDRPRPGRLRRAPVPGRPVDGGGLAHGGRPHRQPPRRAAVRTRPPLHLPAPVVRTGRLRSVRTAAGAGAFATGRPRHHRRTRCAAADGPGPGGADRGVRGRQRGGAGRRPRCGGGRGV